MVEFLDPTITAKNHINTFTPFCVGLFVYVATSPANGYLEEIVMLDKEEGVGNSRCLLGHPLSQLRCMPLPSSSVYSHFLSSSRAIPSGTIMVVACHPCFVCLLNSSFK